MLELTLEADPRQLAGVRDRIDQMFGGTGGNQAWRVKLVACELLTLSIEQGGSIELGGSHDVVLRVLPSGDQTRVEIVDSLANAPAFDSLHGRLIVRLSSAWGVLREPPGHRTLWCDVARPDSERPGRDLTENR